MKSLLSRTNYLIVLIFVIIPAFTLLAKSGTISPVKSKQIIKQIREKQLHLDKKYARYSFIEDATTKVYNSKSHELEETSRVVKCKKTLGSNTAEQKVLKYFKNGEELPVSEYKEKGKREPRHAVFGKNGEKHYDPQVIGMKPINGKICYQVQVNPKEETKKHMKGNLFFEADSLELVRLEGTMTKLPIGVKKMALNINFISIDGYAMPTSSDIEVHAHIPFVFPNKKLIIKNIYSQQKLIADPYNQ
jgi:hypothetical protein